MTSDERQKYARAIRIIDKEMIDRPNLQNIPTISMQDAIEAAVDAMEKQMRATRKPLRRHINVLCYHISHPAALIFKDDITIDALAAGILAMRWLIERDNEEKEAASKYEEE